MFYLRKKCRTALWDVCSPLPPQGPRSTQGGLFPATQPALGVVTLLLLDT